MIYDDDAAERISGYSRAAVADFVDELWNTSKSGKQLHLTRLVIHHPRIQKCGIMFVDGGTQENNNCRQPSKMSVDP